MVRILRVFLLAFGLASLLFGGFSAFAVENAPPPSVPSVRYVAPDGDDDGNDCSHSTTACASIQHAVDVAAAGDEVRVAAGHYAGVRVRDGLTQTVFISKSLTVRGGYTTTNWTESDPKANPAVLDAQGLGRVMTIRGPISVTVDGLEITGGDAQGLGGGMHYGVPSDSGGGILAENTTFTLNNSRIYSNTAHDGGGLYTALGDSTILRNSTFLSNTAQGIGGGLLFIGVDFLGDTLRIECNRAMGIFPESGNIGTLIAPGSGGGGGGLLVGDRGVLRNSYVAGNESDRGGGGLDLGFTDGLLLHNQIVRNRGSMGGGLTWLGGKATLIDNNISQNQANYGGGGISLMPESGRISANTITDNVALNGGGGGVFVRLGVLASGQTQIWDTLIARNRSAGEGGGLAIISSLPGKSLVITNSVVIDNQTTSLGSGVYLDATTTRIDMNHLTVARNSGGDGSGLYFTGTIRSDGSVLPPELASRLWITNSIVAGQNTGLFAAPNQKASMNGILWHEVGQPTSGSGTFEVKNAITGDPCFAMDGYHLMAGSAAIDKGVPTNITVDIDGDARPQGMAPDLGADEYVADTSISCTQSYLPLIVR